MPGRHIEDIAVPDLHATSWREGVNGHVPSPKPYPAGAVLLEQGNPVDDVFLVERGLVKLRRVQPGGKESIIGIRSAGDILGGAAAILDSPNPVDAIAVTCCCLSRMDSREFVRRLKSDPVFSWRLHLMHSREVYGDVDLLAELGCESAGVRLRRLLVNLASELGSDHSNGRVTFVLPLKQWEVAQLIAVTPQYLCQLFATLEREGLLRRDGPSIVIYGPVDLSDPTTLLTHRTPSPKGLHVVE